MRRTSGSARFGNVATDKPDRVPATTRPTPGDTGYAAEDWRRYAQLEQLVNHWDRPGWTPGRRSYHWLISLDDSGLRELAARCQAQLADFDQLDPVPLSSLHITLRRAGFTDEISRDDALAIAKAAERRCRSIAPFILDIGPLAGSVGAVRFSAGPHKPVLQVRDCVRNAVTRVRGPDESASERTAPFVPHVSIAYCHEPTVAKPVIERVARLRALGAVTVPVSAAQLVKMWREDREYRWEVIGVVELRAEQRRP